MVAMQSHDRFEHWEALKLFYSPTIQSRFNFVFSTNCWFTDRTGVRMGFLVPCGAVQGGVVWSLIILVLRRQMKENCCQCKTSLVECHHGIGIKGGSGGLDGLLPITCPKKVLIYWGVHLING